MAPSPIDPDLEAMIAIARNAMDRAYAPYSGYLVGACIRGASGRLYGGANVENAAYPQGQCAETSAIGAMIMGGDRAIREIVVIGAGPDLTTPCGGCRQRIREFATPDVKIHVCGPEGVRRSFTLDELLPFAFGPDNLEA